MTTNSTRWKMVREPDSVDHGAADKLTDPETVARILSPLFKGEPSEIFAAVFMDAAAHLIGVEVISRGGLAASIVEPRAVFRSAVLNNAASVIVAHNHPSGNLEPSQDDVSVTKTLADAGAIMGVPVRDHLILAPDGGYTSLLRRGLM